MSWTIYAYSEMKDEYSEIAMAEALSQIKYNYNFIDIDILWIEKNRRRDKDNIAAAIKFILDGIVDAAIIENDGWKQVNNITHSYDVDSKNPRIEITIKEVNFEGKARLSNDSLNNNKEPLDKWG